MFENRRERDFKKNEGLRIKRKSHRSERFLLIEDDDEFSRALSFVLEREVKADVHVASDSFEAENLMAQQSFDLIITDWRLPSLNGFSALRKAEQSLSLDPMAPAEWFGEKKIPVIVVTVCDSSEVEREKRPKGCFQFLGVISKEQSMEGILEQIELLYENKPLTSTG